MRIKDKELKEKREERRKLKERAKEDTEWREKKNAINKKKESLGIITVLHAVKY